MPLYLCGECILQGYCRNLRSRAVTSKELTPEFVRDLRRYAASLCITPDGWRDYLIAGYRDYAGRIVDQRGKEIALDTEVFTIKSIRYWFRDFCRPCTNGMKPRIRRESRKRIIVMASILRALDPVAAMLWGKVIANDNGGENMRRAPVRTTNRECRYQQSSES